MSISSELVIEEMEECYLRHQPEILRQFLRQAKFAFIFNLSMAIALFITVLPVYFLIHHLTARMHPLHFYQ